MNLLDDAVILECLADRLDNHDPACPGWIGDAKNLKEVATRMRNLHRILAPLCMAVNFAESLEGKSV